MTGLLSDSPAGRGRLVAWVALVAALTPIVIAIMRAWHGGRIAVGDAGYFVARSRDVLTSHHPFVGAFSSGSAGASAAVNNLGPLQFDLLAPFTKLDPYWGAILGAGVINIAAVVGTWATARRLFGPLGVAATMLATLALQATMGSSFLVDTRQQTALLLPFWCLLWLIAALAAGGWWAMPWAAFVASVLVQTHVSYVYLVAATATAGVIAAATTRHDEGGRRWARPAGATAVVLAACWAQTLWDQLFGTGNLGRVLSVADGDGSGAAEGARLVADSTLVPPFFAPGGIARYLDDGLFNRPTIATPVAFGVIVAWAAALGAVIVLARRLGHRAIAASGVVALVALGAAWVSAARLPEHPQAGPLPQNYFWMWPIGVFLTTTIAAGMLLAVRSRLDVRLTARSPRIAYAVTAALVLTAVPAIRARDYWVATAYEPGVGRPLLDEVREGLRNHDIDGPLVLTFFWGVGVDDFNYILLTELQRAGVDFVFPEDNPNVRRFGRQRCMNGTERTQLVHVYGQRPQPRPGETVLAAVDLLPAAEAAELDALDARFGDALRDGTLHVDDGIAAYFGRRPPAGLDVVLATPGRPAHGLAGPIRDLQPWGAVTIDGTLTDDWDRWQVLETRAENTRVAFVLVPNRVPATSACT